MQTTLDSRSSSRPLSPLLSLSKTNLTFIGKVYRTPYLPAHAVQMGTTHGCADGASLGGSTSASPHTATKIHDACIYTCHSRHSLDGSCPDASSGESLLHTQSKIKLLCERHKILIDAYAPLAGPCLPPPLSSRSASLLLPPPLFLPLSRKPGFCFSCRLLLAAATAAATRTCANKVALQR